MIWLIDSPSRSTASAIWRFWQQRGHLEEAQGRPLVMIAGLSGKTAQAKTEAGVARALGYHCGMLSLGAMKGASIDELIEHCAAVAKEIPLVGFYLQTAVGGIPLPMEFWRGWSVRISSPSRAGARYRCS
jgi:hypothetical protein